MQRIIEKPNKVVITDRMWARLLSSTNQPSFMNPPKDTVVGGKPTESIMPSNSFEKPSENENHVDDQHPGVNGSI